MLRDYSLDDKYALESGVVYMTGVQALVRLPLEQMRRDRRRGLKTGCFISGYEGSPLGGYDLALERASRLLTREGVHFQPGVNEELAAAAVCGSQLHQILPGAQVDGVVGIWYGKGPGVDRSGDAFRHANLAGTGENCGALALAGDDHVSKSSTIPHQSELSLFNFAMPILAPGNVQEVLDFGLYGIAMSRFCGAWTALKLATDVCDGGGTLEVSPERRPIEIPEIDGRPFQKNTFPLLITPGSLEAERDLFSRRLEAARVFARVNKINRIRQRGERDRLGIVTAGKAYADLRSALRNMDLGERDLDEAGVRILQLGMVYPLEPEILAEFADGLETIVVIEEKRSFIELQLREHLYHHPQRPEIFGKTSPDGQELFPAHGELDAELIVRALARWLPGSRGAARRIEQLDAIAARLSSSLAPDPRQPSYCSGCPHNRSTLLLEGQIASGGIGCHGMAALDDSNRGATMLAQMGSEGAHWIGMAPFTSRDHLFQNIGDGTYFHSGRQAIAAAVAAGVKITYKILHNGAVAMTGGQQAAGAIGIPEMTRELEAWGTRRITILTDDLDRYKSRSALAPGTELRPREDLEDVLREVESVPGVSVLIYDQMCAAEKRRARSRGKMPQPVRRLLINERVCEGCGDCVAQSNCVSLRPVETEFGPKTRIHQSSCNADYTCALGDCPSFVSVIVEKGSALKRRAAAAPPVADLPEPALPGLKAAPYHILMPGIGGTGVVTINAVLATAALIDGLSVISLDQTGLAQKGGAVVSHLTLSSEPIEAAQRISFGATDLLLGFDVLGAATAVNLQRADPGRTAAVINRHQTPTLAAVRQGLTILSADQQLERRIAASTRPDAAIFVDAENVTEQLLGSHLQANIFLTGVAWQAGRIPISREAIEKAIRLNGVAVDQNLRAFGWGRAYVGDRSAVERVLEPKAAPDRSLDERIEQFSSELVAYQNQQYADAYRSFLEEARQQERRIAPGSERLTVAVAKNLFKLMAYKDEYETARLLTDPAFDRQARAAFEKPRRIVYHLHPPLLRAMGLKRKLSLGSWFRPVLRLLARAKFLRGTPLDPFGGMRVRREERALIGWYRDLIRSALTDLRAETLDHAVALAELPDRIRGYEQIKLRSIEAAKAAAEQLRASDRQRPAA